MRNLIVSLIGMALLVLAPRAEALRPVRVFEVNVSSQLDAATQALSGLRQVLVRATGARDAANDPALSGILAQAQQYVIATRPAGSGSTTLVFDAAALSRDITAAGRALWASDRPLLLIVLTGGPAFASFQSRRQVEGALDSAGNLRGQPVRVARPEALNLPAGGGDIPIDVALAAAQRLGADAVMVGYGDAAVDGGPWRWNMAAPGITESWSGSLEEGVNGAADIFVRNAQAFAALPEQSILVEIENVPTLRDYARVADILGAAGGVESVQLAEVSGTRATFSVVARGGADSLQSALAGNTSLERTDPAAGGSVAFRYRP
ncbi:MAG TPA: DUF2066 domain-containing protein [Steroidobacteraceae bacterium]|nr:DUF2066 domain-containing protein [Steroidobacteraceae bacterium]